MLPLMSRSQRSDPAPSRWAYRMTRFMLSPFLRRTVYFGIPTAVVVGAVALYASDVERREHIAGIYQDAYRSIIERPEFMVKVVAIHGASPALDLEIRDVLPVDLPMSQFDLDLQEIHSVLTELDPIAKARIQVTQSGTIQIDVEERQPAFLWRNRDTLEVLDDSGAFVRFAVNRMDYPNLPLIAGEGADTQVPQAKSILAAARPIADRVRGLVYVGERRWNVLLENDQSILLPERNPVQAIERVLVLDQTQDLLARKVSVVDMRLSQRPTIRIAPDQIDQVIDTSLTTMENDPL